MSLERGECNLKGMNESQSVIDWFVTKVFGDSLWLVVSEINGWRLESHKIAKHYRIVNRDGVTMFLGNQDCIRKSFGRIVEYDMNKDRIGLQ